MNMLASIPDAVRTTLQTFETLIHADDKRRRELEAEIAALTLRERVIGATQDASWITRCFIEPRVAELRAIEARINLISTKLERLREEWSRPQPASLSLPATRWFDSGTPAVICLAA
ncbi:MAG: hypothetical protein IT580_17525 [Verrucomicrobiales bacterium]|nr:hypothetical protein [Verrucomicrobiales bacterium]